MRRENWMAALLEEVGGLVPVELPTGEGWHRAGGPDADPDEVRFQMFAATEKVSRKSALSTVEAAFLAKHSPGQYKITMQSSSMGAMLWNPELSPAVYPSPDVLVQDLAALQAREIEDLLAAGVNWIQLDSLSYMQVIDQDFAERLGQSGVSIAEGLDRSVAVDNQLIRTARKKNPAVTVGLHFCRGNNRSAYAASGSYDPVAEKLFGEVEVDRFLLEYDT